MTARRTLALFVSTLLIGPCVSAENPPGMQEQAKAAVSTTQGKLKLRGLQEPVNVLRDRWGVAHIYAQNQHDLFFAQGFVVAQDRLFQMELWKRSGEGRLAEILGAAALSRDLNARLLRYRGVIDAEYRSYAHETKETLEGFTDGSNAFIAGGKGRMDPGYRSSSE